MNKKIKIHLREFRLLFMLHNNILLITFRWKTFINKKNHNNNWVNFSNENIEWFKFLNKRFLYNINKTLFMCLFIGFFAI